MSSVYVAGKLVYGLGEAVYAVRQLVYVVGEAVYGIWQLVYGAGEEVYGSWQQVYTVGRLVYVSGEEVYRVGEVVNGSKEVVNGGWREVYGNEGGLPIREARVAWLRANVQIRARGGKPADYMREFVDDNENAHFHGGIDDIFFSLS